MRAVVFIIGLLLCWSASGAEQPPETDLQFFETRVRPVLAERCYQCHSVNAQKLKGGLLLDSRAGALKGGETGKVISPGDARASRLVEAINYQNVDLQMPPKGKLPPNQIEDLTRWVQMGAPWPKEPAPLPAAARLGFDLEARKAKHWAWRPIRAVAPPDVQNTQWARDPIDRFVLARLEGSQLAPAAQADRRTLIRRASFDLIGLPPTPAEVEAFVNDPSPDTFAKVVDRLLASPHFGEHWARHWMDLVRYAETYGHEFDYPIANAWQYRDYLIRAYNADVPYDQFVTEHIAGDLLPHPRLNPREQFNESIIATGFWFFTEQIHAPVDVRQHQCDRLDNQIDVFGKTFLGLTIACARCHDHKFDAISQEDYYSLSGYIESSRRQDAMLDPGKRIEQATDELRSLQTQAEKLFAQSLPASPKDQIAHRLLRTAGVAVEPKVHLSSAADADAEDPLYSWSVLARIEENDQFAAQRSTALAKLQDSVTLAHQSASQTQLFSDLGDPSRCNWFPAGWSFSQVPVHCGQVELTSQGFRAAMPGIAHSGTLSHALRGVLRSATFILSKPQILYHIAGVHGQVRLIIDQYMMDQFSPLLFAGASFKVDTGGKFIWHRQAQDVSRYVGQRAYIEIIDDGDGWVALDQIRFADADAPAPAPMPSAISLRVLQDLGVKDAESLASAYGTIAAEAIARFREGQATADDCRLINRLLDLKLIELDEEGTAQLADLARRIRAIESQIPAPLYAPAIADGNGLDAHLLIRGNPRTPGDVAPRHLLKALAGDAPSAGALTSGRLQLARELVDPSNPFTSRVMVNRVWHHLMGRGIVASVDNFGVLGEEPSHPELLDHLANRFMHDGWSIKRLIRDIMLSSTYQMSSAATDAAAEQRDPANVLLHRANARRLPAESIRDQMLAISGRLDQTIFGPPVDVFLTPFMEGRGRPESGPLDGAGRRSIYLAVRRNFLSPMLLAFDMPTPFSAMGRRNVSNVPAQALTLMNDPFVLQQADLWAKRALSYDAQSPEQRVSRMFEAAYARPPTQKELAQAMKFLRQQADAMGIAESDANDQRLWAAMAHAMMNTKEFIFLQ
jgi:hypothetical protein